MDNRIVPYYFFQARKQAKGKTSNRVKSVEVYTIHEICHRGNPIILL